MKTLIKLISAVVAFAAFGGMGYIVLNGGATAFTGNRRAQSFDAILAPVIDQIGVTATAGGLALIGLIIAGYILFSKDEEEEA